MRRWTWIAAVAAMTASFLPPPVAAQSSDAVGIVTTIDGRATVARPALPSPLAIKFKDDVFGRDRISTQENSLVRVLLGGKAILTVRELSQVTISEEPGRAVVTLPDGKVVLAVDKKRMRPGESIEIRTPNAVAAVRGSLLSVSVTQGNTTSICAAGECFYGHGGQPMAALPPGQRALNAQIAPATATEMNQAFNFRSSLSMNEAEKTFQAAEQMNVAGGVAQFLNTGGLVPIPPPGTGGQLQIPNINPIGGGQPPGGASTPPSGGDGGGGGSSFLVNGGFETGDFSGWTRSGNPGFTSVTTSPSFVRSGTFAAFLGPIGSDGFLSQTLETVPGKPYIVSFSLRSDGGLPNDFNASWAGTSFFSQTNIPSGEYLTYTFTEVAPGASTVLQFGFRNDPGFLGLDDVSVVADPPLYFLSSGDTLRRTGTDPLLQLSGTPQTFDSLMVVCCGGEARLAGPLLRATDSDLTVPYSLVSLLQGGTLVSTSTDPLVQLLGGTHSFGGAGLPIFDIAGISTATDAETGLSLGTDRPLQFSGSLFETSQATVTAHQAVRIDTALLEATAPLLALTNGSKLTTAADTIQLSHQAKVSSLGSLVKLDRSSLVVARGAALNVAGGSLLRVTGDLFSLTNGSTLSVLNGALLSLSGGSMLSVNGALIGFGGSGGNLVSVANSFCPCTTIGGIPVSLTGGALASNVSITGAIKNSGLGTVTLAPNAALIRVDGAATRVTIGGL
jgi:FecR-like protein